MEQIKNAIKELREIIKATLPTSNFDVNIKLKDDSNYDEYIWIIDGRIDTKEGWNDFTATGADFDMVFIKAKMELKLSIQELQAGVA